MSLNAASKSNFKDTALFLKQMALQPGKVGSVIPSSRYLARAMVSGIDPARGNVIEFGGGTGRVTEQVLARGVAPENLVVFEINQTFIDLLEKRFPAVTVLPWFAQRAVEAPIENVRTIVSGLPLLAMPGKVQEEILVSAFAKLEPDGEYVQFTYGPKPPVSAEIIKKLGLSVEKRTRIYRNVPPASVYVFRKLA